MCKRQKVQTASEHHRQNAIYLHSKKALYDLLMLEVKKQRNEMKELTGNMKMPWHLELIEGFVH